MGHEQSDVRRNPISRFQPNHIAHDNFFSVNFQELSVPFHSGLEFENFLQSLGALISSPFLSSAYHRI